jgi:hypothetical protein
MNISKDHLIEEIEKLKPRKDIFVLSEASKAKIQAYNKVIRLINKFMNKKKLQKIREEGYLTCSDCGLKYGRASGVCATFHIGKCDVCGEKKYVTEFRDFNYLRK